MSDLEKMIASARNAMIHVLDLEPKDKVLVVTDQRTGKIGRAFQEAAAEHGCGVDSYVLPEEKRPLAEVPPELSAMLEDKSVAINCFQAIAEETPFRIDWIKEIFNTKQIRLGHSPGITESMMTSGAMNVDFARMRAEADKLIEAFAGATRAHITTPAGTDLTLDITDRPFRSDAHATVERGVNLPCGEIYCAPVETGADGLLVIDGTIGGVDEVPTDPVHITIAQGRIQKLASESSTLVAAVEKLTGVDDEASVIGELGIGLNPGAKLVGNMLEDEKAFRTAHIAFGNNSEMPGGQNDSRTHHDFLFHRPTFEVSYQDGSRRVLIKDGDFQI
jgi:leucyl aminopeptidase (aminopeptidase T)